MKGKDWEQEREARKRKWVSRLEYWSDKVNSLLWMLVALYILYESNFFYVIWNSSESNKLFLVITMILFGIFSTLVVYGSFFMPEDEDVEVTAPSLLPMTSAVGGLLFFCALVAFWPIWGWFTPLILIVLHIGLVKVGTSFPSSKWGSAATISVFLAAAASAGLIPHKGLLH